MAQKGLQRCAHCSPKYAALPAHKKKKERKLQQPQPLVSSLGAIHAGGSKQRLFAFVKTACPSAQPEPETLRGAPRVDKRHRADSRASTFSA